jgi:hypothetical protein
VQTTEPFRTTALASWIDGAPARTGLGGRFAQALDSVFGADHAPVLMTVTVSHPSRLSPDASRRVVAGLKKLVTAQTDLTAQLETISRVP